MVVILEIIQEQSRKNHTKYLRYILRLFIIFVLPLKFYASDSFDIRLKTTIFFNEELPSKLPSNYKYFNKVNKLPKHTKRPIVEVKYIENSNLQKYRPNFTNLEKITHNISSIKREKIQNAKSALSIKFAYPNKILFNSLKKANEIIYLIAKRYNGVIWDIESKEMFSAKQWKEKRIKRDLNSTPLAENQISIKSFVKRDKLLAISFGMSKFGQPDILIKNFSVTNYQSIKNLINLISQSLIEGQKVGRNINIDTNKISNKEYLKRIFSIKQKDDLNIKLPISMARWEEDFANNLIIEILFDNIEGKNIQEKQSKLLYDIFGIEENVDIKSDKILRKYKNKAKQEDSMESIKIDSHNITSSYMK